MPAKDLYHDNVVRALIKAGWSILGEQVRLIIGGRRLWIDIQAFKDGVTILVEVKSFPTNQSQVDFLADAIGKYALYSAALEYYNIGISLNMAAPDWAYEGILSETIGRQVIGKLGIKLIVFDPEREEITRWTT